MIDRNIKLDKGLWNGTDVQKLISDTKVELKGNERCIIEGRAPVWVMGALAGALKPYCPVVLRDAQNKDINISELSRSTSDVQKLNDGIYFLVMEDPTKDRVNIMWAIDRDFDDESSIRDIIIPYIPENRGVCIFGEGPLHLRVIIGTTYALHNSFVSYYQKGLNKCIMAVPKYNEQPIGHGSLYIHDPLCYINSILSKSHHKHNPG